MNQVQRTCSCLLVAATLLSLGSCGAGDEAEIEEVRRAPAEARFTKPNASSSERFGGGQGAEHEHTPGAKPFAWSMPDDWVELPAKQFRDVNLRPAGDPELECYLTILQGDGGGLTANVNRWRSQLGLDAITDADVKALPTAELFGRPAVSVQISTEGDEARMLLGLILVNPASMATVKMTGPAERVETQRAGFEQVCRTLAVSEAPPAEAAPTDTTPPPSGLTFTIPEGWTDAGASSMRIVNLAAPGPSQCYVIRLGGEAGGLDANLNRWRGEVGHEPLDAAAIAALPKVELLGQSCSLLEVTGEYRGMGGPAGADHTLLGVALIGAESSLFVKMVGPKDDIAAHKQKFIDFLASLKEG